MIEGILADLLIFVSGMIAMGFALFPTVMNSWEEGYEAARERYDNWHLGFTEGFDAGVEYGLTVPKRGKQDENRGPK